MTVWFTTLLPGWPSDLSFGFIILLSGFLLVIEFRFNFRYLQERVFDIFVEKLYLINFAVVALIASVSSLILIFSSSWVSITIIILAITLVLFQIGTVIGATIYRKNHVSAAFPWDLVSAYERSLNPNIRKTYGPFIYVIVPLFIIAIIVDLRLLSIVILLQLDNVYTRIRMTIPISAFLTTGYEKSVDAWLTLKRASGELSIPGLVVDKEGRVPSDIAIQQDFVRIEADDSWLTNVSTVLKYCRYIVFDTHSVSEAVRKEIDLVLKTEYMSKTYFIRRDSMDPFMQNAATTVEKALGQQRLLSVEEIAQMFRDERNSAVGTTIRNPLQDAITAAKAPKLRIRK